MKLLDRLFRRHRDRDREKPGPGLADVDPTPLAQYGAEGIDPDATDDAHRSVRDQRERLPEHGKNLP